LSIQILQYEFLGPIKLHEWGPPMEKVVYLIMSRQKDSFNIIYAGDCDYTADDSFFKAHSSFECWIKSDSEESLYLAILPLFNSEKDVRKRILEQIIRRYRPNCNLDIKFDTKPHYKISSNFNLHNNPNQKSLCPCCGSEMKVEKILENTTVIRCLGCGLSDTKSNS